MFNKSHLVSGIITASVLTLMPTKSMADCCGNGYGSSSSKLSGTYYYNDREFPISKPYAFREGNPDYGRGFVEHIAWDYALTVREGETLEDIATEIYGDPTQWTILGEYNNIDHNDHYPEHFRDSEFAKKLPLNDSFDFTRELPVGTKLLVYFTSLGLGSYLNDYPEREIEDWRTQVSVSNSYFNTRRK